MAPLCADLANRIGRLCPLLALILIAATNVCIAEDSPFVSGYAGSWSIAPGEPAAFHLSGAPNENATLTIYDVHYKPVETVTASIQLQEVDADNLEPWVNGLGYAPQLLDLPDLHSGIYYLDGPTLSGNRIPFLVNNHEEVADVVVVYPTNTINAYS